MWRQANGVNIYAQNGRQNTSTKYVEYNGSVPRLFIYLLLCPIVTYVHRGLANQFM